MKVEFKTYSSYTAKVILLGIEVEVFVNKTSEDDRKTNPNRKAFVASFTGVEWPNAVYDLEGDGATRKEAIGDLVMNFMADKNCQKMFRVTV